MQNTPAVLTQADHRVADLGLAAAGAWILFALIIIARCRAS